MSNGFFQALMGDIRARWVTQINETRDLAIYVTVTTGDYKKTHLNPRHM